MTQQKTFVALISGRGSNLQSILNACDDGTINAQMSAVICNEADAGGLPLFSEQGYQTHLLEHKKFDSRDAFDQALMQLIDQHQPDFLVMAGFMRILTPAFIQHYEGRSLNIHPSLLPKFTGLHTHQRAIEAGEKHHGASVHFVTEELDGGPTIIQAKVDVLEGDTAETLAQRVLKEEHKIFPQAIQWIADEKVKMCGNSVAFDGAIMPSPAILENGELTIPS